MLKCKRRVLWSNKILWILLFIKYSKILHKKLLEDKIVIIAIAYATCNGNEAILTLNGKTK